MESAIGVERHPLPALLSLAVVGMLAGMISYEAIVQYGKERGWGVLQLRVHHQVGSL